MPLCCDLLSDLYFAVLNNNTKSFIDQVQNVVICFQICTLQY